MRSELGLPPIGSRAWRVAKLILQSDENLLRKNLLDAYKRKYWQTNRSVLTKPGNVTWGGSHSRGSRAQKDVHDSLGTLQKLGAIYRPDGEHVVIVDRSLLEATVSQCGPERPQEIQ